MTIRIGINGFGRIGRAIFKIIHQSYPNIEVVHINDLGVPKGIAHVLKYDSVHGRFDADVQAQERGITVDGKFISLTADREPLNLPWGEKDVDIVIEATGAFRTREGLQKHLTAGAKKVLLSATPKDKIDGEFVVGINDHLITPDMKMISNASCTTNCLAPIAKVLDDAFGIDSALMTTAHAYTSTQKLLDVEETDLRKSRAAAINIVPATTGAATAVTTVLPQLTGKINGRALRVPVADGSIVDLVANLSKNVTVEDINQAFKNASETTMKGLIKYETDPIVSSDVIGQSYSAIYDVDLTMVVGGNMVKIFAWYDNEWGYSSRMVDLIEKMMA